jgi:hypothetical protein
MVAGVRVCYLERRPIQLWSVQHTLRFAPAVPEKIRLGSQRIRGGGKTAKENRND